MSDQTDRTWTANGGISRRTLLRRGAVVGGALLWTTPIVQSIPNPAFAAGSPPPPDGPAISHVAVVVRCADERTFRAKVNIEEAAWEDDPGGPTKGPQSICYPQDYWDAAGTEPIKGDDHGLVVTIDPADPSKATLSVPSVLTGLGSEDCTVVRVDATAKGGRDCTGGSAQAAPFVIDFDL